jgi:tetratricopeptide (TPR) repeat protein
VIRINITIIYLLFAFSVNNLFAQDSIKSTNTRNNDAVSYFVEGKTADLKGDYVSAIQSYRNALIYDKSPGIFYAISVSYYNLGKFQDALIEINNALKQVPDEIDYLDQKAKIYFTMDKLDKASEVYENILKLDSNYTFALFALARIYQELKQPSKAIVIYEQITDRLGFDYEVLKRMYDIYYNFREYDKCIEVLQYALKLDPYNAAYLQQLATLYAKQNRDEDAKKIFEELYMLSPGDRSIQTELVKIYFKNNETKRGFEEFEKISGKTSLSYEEKLQIGELYYALISQDASAIEIAKNIFIYLNNEYPEKWQPYFYLGEFNLNEKDNNSAETNFKKAYEYSDTSLNAYIQVGYAYITVGKLDIAETILQKGIEKYDYDFRLFYFYGIAMQRTGGEEKAIEYFEKALNLSPNEMSVLSTLAMAYHSKKRYRESEEIYEKALKIEPENILILNNYAYNLCERGVNLQKALSMSKKTIEKEPENPSYLDTYGWIYYMLGKYDTAKIYVEKAVTINGSSAVLLEHLGDIYFAMKDETNAKKYWLKSLELSPNNENMKEKLKFLQ